MKDHQNVNLSAEIADLLLPLCEKYNKVFHVSRDGHITEIDYSQSPEPSANGIEPACQQGQCTILYTPCGDRNRIACLNPGDTLSVYQQYTDGCRSYTYRC